MSRYIDADKTLEALDCLFKESNVKCLDLMRVGYNHAVADSIDAVKGQSIVEVVRCKDCRWFDLTDPCGTLTPNAHRCKRVTRLWMEDDAFCAYGERREDIEGDATNSAD